MTELEQDVQQHGIRWIERWYGSDPMKGSAILTEHRSEIAVLGGDEKTHKEVRKVVMAHNAALAAFAEREARLLEALQSALNTLQHIKVYSDDAGPTADEGIAEILATLAAIKEPST